MAAPTQAYPPWLTPQAVTITQDGVAVPQTTVVQLPQTYYGPSIPLDSDWVYGGSVFPASIATSFSASTTPSPSVTPTTSVASTSSQTQSPTSTSSSTTTTTTSSLSSSVSSSASSAPPSSTSASTSINSGSTGLSSGTRLAVILSTILGTLMLGALLCVVLRLRRRVRRRRGLAVGGGLSWSFINHSSAQQHVQPGADEEERLAGEVEAFLPPEPNMQENIRRPPVLLVASRPSLESTTVPDPTMLATRSRPGSTGTKTDSSTLDSDAKREDIARFNASSSTADAGSLFFNPGRGVGDGGTARRSDEATPDEPTLAAGVAAAFASTPRNYATRPPGAGPPRVSMRSSTRSVVTPTALYFNPASPRSALEEEGQYENDVQRLNALRARESLEEQDNEAQLLPPRRINPDNPRGSQPSSPGSRGSWAYPDSPPSETDERATLLTARRVNIGQATPMLASPATEKKSLEGWITPPNEDEEAPPVSPGSWSVSMGGLAGFAKGLGRLSWFRRMDNEPGPSGTRRSPSQSRSQSRRGSRPSSMVARSTPIPRPHSGLLRPPFGSRPQSGVSFRSIDGELGLRPPGVRASATGSGSGGSGSGKSGATVYHSVSSRPRTPFYTAGAEHASHEPQFAHAEPTMVTLPPDLDLGEGRSTVRSVDVLDLPVPERSLPFGPTILPDTSSHGTRQDTVSSKGTTSGAALTFPPGLISVPKWDKESHSGSSNREARDVLEDEPPQAGGEWSSLRSKASTTDVKEEITSAGRRRGGLVTRSSTGEQAVQVVMGEHAASETASIATGPRQPSDQNAPAASVSPRSPRNLAGFGLSLTPRVSMYESRSDVASHSGDGSYSSQRSHAATHSQGLSQPSSNQESEDGHPPPPQGPGFNRASLSAIGGELGPPQIPPIRPLSNMQPMLEQTSEDRETEDSDTSRPGTGTSRPMSEMTHTGTFASGTGSTGVQTTVPSSPGSGRKR